MRDPVALDRVECFLGVELLQHDGGDAAGLHLHRPHRRRGVVQRGWAQIDGIGVEPEAHQRRHHAGRLRGRDVWQGPLDALRPTRRSGRVLKEVALPLVVDRRFRLVRNALRVALPTVQIVVGDQERGGKSVG